jgi:hypothetical protein
MFGASGFYYKDGGGGIVGGTEARVSIPKSKSRGLSMGGGVVARCSREIQYTLVVGFKGAH